MQEEKEQEMLQAPLRGAVDAAGAGDEAAEASDDAGGASEA